MTTYPLINGRTVETCRDGVGVRSYFHPDGERFEVVLTIGDFGCVCGDMREDEAEAVAFASDPRDALRAHAVAFEAEGR